MMRLGWTWCSLALACAIFIGIGGAIARPGGKPVFNVACKFGSGTATVATENGRLIFRYERKSKSGAIIREDRRAGNVFYRHDSQGLSGSSQQIRFVQGNLSYSLTSWFFAGRNGYEGLWFSVLRNGKVLSTQECKNAWGFDEDNQLDQLPADPVVPLGGPR